MNVTWVVQTNLGGHYADSMKNACRNLNLPFVPQDIIPFSDDMPDISTDGFTIFYGATNWINNIFKSSKWRPGVFFNPNSLCNTWLPLYKEHAINYGANITTFNQLEAQDRLDDELIFVRPCSDQKEFAGQVMSFREIKDWRSKMIGDVEWISSCDILVAEPVGIAHEWRLFIVNGKVSSGSHYRSYHKLDISPNIPTEVINFAKERAKEYSPSSVFVMDIGESAGKLYIIEVGCFNSAGFYAADVEKIIHDISGYVINNV